MRELCPSCLGIGSRPARKYDIDHDGNPISGDVECYNCRGRGSKDWHNTEAHLWSMEFRQKMLRAAVDLGGSVYSKESRLFKVEEVRWGAISSVYFQPKRICELLGLVFPGDVADAESAVKHASWDPSHAWRVTPKTGDQHHHAFCKALQLQLNQQVRIEEAPQFAVSVMPRDDRSLTYIKELKRDLDQLINHISVGPSWRDAVEAVKSARPGQQAA